MLNEAFRYIWYLVSWVWVAKSDLCLHSNHTVANTCIIRYSTFLLSYQIKLYLDQNHPERAPWLNECLYWAQLVLYNPYNIHNYTLQFYVVYLQSPSKLTHWASLQSVSQWVSLEPGIRASRTIYSLWKWEGDRTRERDYRFTLSLALSSFGLEFIGRKSVFNFSSVWKYRRVGVTERKFSVCVCVALTEVGKWK